VARTKLQTEKEIYIATQRANGQWSTAGTRVVYLRRESRLFDDCPHSYKAGRIKRSSPVRIWVAATEGPSLPARPKL